MLSFSADCVRTLVNITTLDPERHAAVVAEIVRHLPSMPGHDESAVFTTFARAYTAWMRGGRRVYHIDQDTWKQAMDAACAGVDIILAPIHGAVAMQLDIPVELGEATWLHGLYLWNEGEQLWFLPVYGGFRFEDAGPAIGRFLKPPIQDPIAGTALVLLAALQDQRVGKIIQWHATGLRASRLAQRIPAARRRLIYAGDHTTITTRKQVQEPHQDIPATTSQDTTQAEHAPHTPPCAHLVAAHQGLRWMREARAVAELGESAVLDAIAGDRYREVGTALYVAVPRPIREHLRGKAPTVPIVEKVIGSG